MQTAAVILAAGASTRFGGRKQLAAFDGGTVLDAVVAIARRAGLAPIVVVAPSGVPLPPDAARVSNDDPDLGLSHSLRLGLAAVPEGAQAVILLGDQPTVGVGHLRRLLAFPDSDVVATEAGGILAPPLRLATSAFDLADRLVGDTGLRDVLRAMADDIASISVARHSPDVDVPDDLAALAEACPGCGARFAPLPYDETHRYIGASSACWAAFGELLAREFQDVAYGRVHRHTVDVYSVQHPGADERRQRQSVALHLIGLCHWLEHGLDTPRLNAITQRLADADRPWPWLPPPAEFEMTVQDVLVAGDGIQHGGLVRRWAETTWEAWGDHHELIRRWTREALS
jgi:CTP:molybdopterin cytidylyltransferase MocA